MALTLSGFTISRTGDTYQITIEDEDGGSAQYEATYDQLDLIVEAIEERLDSDEEDGLVVEDGDAEDS
jgi:hypothetical protein